jgi:hypothetical protein
MNVEFIRRLAKHMRRIRHEAHYNQATFARKTECGTAACIAGHAVLLADGRLPREKGVPKYFDHEAIQDRARKLLGLSPMRAARLFCGDPRGDIQWPNEFALRFASEPAKSRVAADLLDAIASRKVKL